MRITGQGCHTQTISVLNIQQEVKIHVYMYNVTQSSLDTDSEILNAFLCVWSLDKVSFFQ